MDANFNLRQHEFSKNPDMAEPTAPIAHQRHLREPALDGIIRFVIIVGYLWVAFALLSVHKNIMLPEYHLNFLEYLFAIVNLLVVAKVLLSCEVFHLRTRFHDRSLTNLILSVRGRKRRSVHARRVEEGRHDTITVLSG
jgi:hypothetical protein